MLDVVVSAFREDRNTIEAQQIVLDLDPNTPMLLLEVDSALLHARRQFDRTIAAETPVSVAAEQMPCPVSERHSRRRPGQLK